MRIVVVLPGILLASLLLSTSTALPPSCGDPCTVLAATPGFAPAVASIGSGGSVVFESIDITHPTGEAFAGGDPCFIASTWGGNPAPPVRFTWDGTTMRADGVTCGTATALPSGEGMLLFQCLLHPNMVGTLTVT